MPSRHKQRKPMVMRGGVAVPLTDESRKGCLGKVQHRSWADADAARARLRAKLREEGDRWPLTVYRCLQCGYWHVGHAQMPRRMVA